MTSRERVLKTLKHQIPDKVPIDFGGMGSTGIMAIAYNQLKKHLGMDLKTTRICDVNQQLAEPEKEILDLFEVDVISLHHSLGKNNEDWINWNLPDGSPAKIHKKMMPAKEGENWVIKDGEKIRFKMVPNCLYFESCNPPLESAASEKEINNYHWKYFTDEYLKELELRAKWILENTEYAIMGGFGGNILEEGQVLRGWSNFMIDLVANQDFTEALLDKLVEVYLRNLEGFLQAVSKYIQIIQMGDDLGTQNGPQISLELYQKMIKPRHKKVYQFVKENSDLYLFLHSCGSIYDFIPDLIDCGVDILNPVQFTAAKMDSKKLKEEFGDKITFWGGGVDTQKILPFGTPAEIEKQVEEQIKILGENGGYVFNSVHNIQSNIPVENILALFDSAKKYRNYNY
ncbi:MAG: methyltransferase [Ignavibacteriales bacterium]|nr:methyltransferase [Ignavibacteriales bacterium]MCB9208756.1 methyltransferase [Ignavibacteriales bacterium]MCB9218326.1 methyltransferase [Ignavibacteriales bacterium]